MYSTYTHATKKLTTSGNFATVDKPHVMNVLKSLFLKMKAKVLMVVKAPSRMRDDVREEMYW